MDDSRFIGELLTEFVPLLYQSGYSGEQQRYTEWFGDIGIRSGLYTFQVFFIHIKGSQQDDGDMTCCELIL